MKCFTITYNYHDIDEQIAELLDGERGGKGDKERNVPSLFKNPMHRNKFPLYQALLNKRKSNVKVHVAFWW